jgi:hypothetical protein
MQVSEEDFCEGGALAHLQMELQLWAAYRGQLLARTVRGRSASGVCGTTPKQSSMLHTDVYLVIDTGSAP